MASQALFSRIGLPFLQNKKDSLSLLVKRNNNVKNVIFSKNQHEPGLSSGISFIR